MTTGQAHPVLRHLRQLVASPGLDALTDGQLLERFVAAQEAAAFAALVRRHGPLVLGVCRRLLRGRADAEDAFQATFIVLFRRARSLDRRGSLAGRLSPAAPGQRPGQAGPAAGTESGTGRHPGAPVRRGSRNRRPGRGDGLPGRVTDSGREAAG